MIVRVAGEGQFEVPDDLTSKLNELDNEAVAAVEAGDQERFHALFAEMHQMVKDGASELPDDALVASDVILPPADLTFEEARREFSGEGLIPD